MNRSTFNKNLDILEEPFVLKPNRWRNESFDNDRSTIKSKLFANQPFFQEMNKIRDVKNLNQSRNERIIPIMNHSQFTELCTGSFPWPKTFNFEKSKSKTMLPIHPKLHNLTYLKILILLVQKVKSNSPKNLVSSDLILLDLVKSFQTSSIRYMIV